MKPQHVLCSRAPVLFVLLLVVPTATIGKATTLSSAAPAPEARTQVNEAASNSHVPPWRRDLLPHLARMATAATPYPEARSAGAAILAADSVDGLWNQLTDGPTRSTPSVMYDPVRNRMLVFGGSDAVGHYVNDVWALSLAATPSWTQIFPSGTPPSPRSGHSAIYDPVRDQMVVFGGADSSSHNLKDVWTLSLTDAPSWSQLTPSGTPPSGDRQGHSAIYDPVRDRMVVFGGFGDYLNPNPNDVWVLSLADTPAWGQLAVVGPLVAGRRNHCAIYDPVRDRMVVFGGASCLMKCYLADAVALSLAGTPTWIVVASGAPPMPSEREGSTAIYDPVRDRMVMFGGYYNHYGIANVFLNDVWALSLTGSQEWSQLGPSGATPSGRQSHRAIYDPVLDRMVLFGGYNYDYKGQVLLNDLWVLAWSTLPDVVAPTVQVLSPNGGEILVNGTTHALTWSASDNVGVQSAHLSLSRTGPAGPWEVLASGIANTGAYDWLVSGAAANNSAYLRVDARDFAGNTGTAISNTAFTVTDLATPTLVERFRAVPTDAGVRIEWELGDPFAFESIALESAPSENGGWNPVVAVPIVTLHVTSVVDAVPPGQVQWYRLRGVLRDGRSIICGPICASLQAAVTAFALSPLSPNPVSGNALLSFAIPTSTYVRLTLADVQGRELDLLSEGLREPGRYTAAVDASGLRAGIYFVRLQARGVNLSRRLVVVK
jgi:hypothetical protein